MAHVEFNEITIIIYIIYIYIYNVTTFFSHKINRKMTMPHKLVWMDEKFM